MGAAQEISTNLLTTSLKQSSGCCTSCADCLPSDLSLGLIDKILRSIRLHKGKSRQLIRPNRLLLRREKERDRESFKGCTLTVWK